LNIKVTNTPGVNADAVADLTLGLMLSIARKIPQYDASVKAGKWGRYVGFGLNGKTLGIVGMGAIGKKVAKRALGFDMNILAYDPFFDDEFAQKNGIVKASIEEILQNSDFVTLHMPVTNETKNLINEESLKKMKKTAYLINAARGPLIDENALYNALNNNQIAGAALDVFETEPLYESPLFALDNIVVQPHLGGHTVEASFMMGKLAIDNTVAVLKGENCRFVVNK
jgi:D-3-phosphoglycerate dehydrogenase